MLKCCLFLIPAIFVIPVFGQSPNATRAAPLADRWMLRDPDGIIWNVANDPNLPHGDHVEMSGFRISTVVHYGADSQGNLLLKREVIWPLLRGLPVKTKASLGRSYDESILPPIMVNGHPLGSEKLVQVIFNGLLELQTKTPEGLQITHTLFPSREQAAVIDNYTILNSGNQSLTLNVASPDKIETTDPTKGVYGSYVLTVRVNKPGAFTLAPGKTCRFSLIIAGRRSDEPEVVVSALRDEAARRDFVKKLGDTFILETPDPVLNRMFQLAKIRAMESIYKTAGGLMHSPGGGIKDRYYAAIWANDQAEYAGPLFPFIGYDVGNEAGLNTYRLFAKYMNPDYKRIPSSIIAEGTSTWNGAKDRGDMAMIAYGASRFALASGDPKIAEELWPLVAWCLEYCHRQLNPQDVVSSDCDELEHRLPAGTANLHTSVLTYDALHSAAYLAHSLGHPEAEAAGYEEQANALKQAMETYFDANVEGFDTYRYYDGDTVLRAWICSPLVAGIMDRKAGTIAALMSPKLWTVNGLTTASGRVDFWDRSTLYALRGIFYVGESDIALAHLRAYSERRLLGDHVPYAVEAYPEGDQSHLAAESALYQRIYSEGLFGIRPTGLHSFSCKISMPSAWNKIALRGMHAFGHIFNLEAERIGDHLIITTNDGVHKIIKTAQPDQAVAFDL